MEHTLKYSSPARIFEESFVMGGGSLGASVYANPTNDRISLNCDTFWSGIPGDEIEDKTEEIKKLQELMREGKVIEAEEHTAKNILNRNVASYLPVGNVYIKSDGEYSNYKRTLDLKTAVADLTYSVGGVNFRREYFVSYPDSCIAVRITADKPKSVSFTLSAETAFKGGFKEENGILYMSGEAPISTFEEDGKVILDYRDNPDERGISFTAGISVIADSCVYSYGDLTVENSDEAVIFICIETSYNGFDVPPHEKGRDHFALCKARIEGLSDYDKIKERHISDFSALYGRAEISLSEKENDLDTDVRLMGFDGSDTGLYELIFNFGRYLMISSSREGTEATNLQGIWNEKTVPPWRSDYTVNINTEMNYWPSFPCNLAECFEPFLTQLEKMHETGRNTAKKMYGARGFTAHHNSDIWGRTTPVSGDAGRNACVWGYWNMASGWMAVQLYDLYEYTLDKAVLKDRIYPIMKDAAEFYIDIMVEDEDGTNIVFPSTSPENRYILNGERCSIAKTSTMTVSIIKELFDRIEKSCEILGIDRDFAEKIKKIKLPDYKCDSEGRLLEWENEKTEADRNHRHVSHLFSLFPGELISPEKTPEVAKMCKKSLEARGDGGTGWSLAWKVNLYAKLLLGDRALDILKNQLNLVRGDGTSYVGMVGGTYPNMLCAHPPFQIDGNFGAASGIANMLLQSTSGKITVLPALPKAWANGSFKGLLAKGNVAVDAYWHDCKVTSLTLTPHAHVKTEVVANGQSFSLELSPEKAVKLI